MNHIIDPEIEQAKLAQKFSNVNFEDTQAERHAGMHLIHIKQILKYQKQTDTSTVKLNFEITCTEWHKNKVSPFAKKMTCTNKNGENR